MIDIRVYRSNMRGGIEIGIFDDGQYKSMVAELGWKEIGEFEPTEPTLSVVKKEQLQNLMDDLWGLGLRPSVKADSYKAELEAVRYHLEDMRELVAMRLIPKKKD